MHELAWSSSSGEKGERISIIPKEKVSVAIECSCKSHSCELVYVNVISGRKITIGSGSGEGEGRSTEKPFKILTVRWCA
jgi:hypothetical protein